MGDQRTVIIVGGGQAAAQVVASLRQEGFGGSLTLISEEAALPYHRPPLSKAYLAGEIGADRLPIKPAAFYEKAEASCLLETRVEAIDRAARTVEVSTGQALSYDALVLATGSRVRELPGAPPGEGLFYLRNAMDADALRPALEAGRSIALIGGGYIGLEVAAVCAKRGLDVTVIEAAPRVLQRVTSPELSAFYQSEHERHGVTFRLGAGVTDLAKKPDGTWEIALAEGTPVRAEAVAIGIGIVPNVALAEAAGLACTNGIDVDENGATEDPAIYAAGDCTYHPNALYGRHLRLESVHNAIEQAKAVAAALCGKPKPYTQVPWFWSDQYDLKLQMAGLSQGYDATVFRGSPADRQFACFYLQGGKLIAVDAVNDPPSYMKGRALIGEGARPNPAQLGDTAVPIMQITG